ncbi:MAG: PAS domain-containing protein [Ignavibacteriales bacterium]|nr:PAS domain-containing protein [Ignavibacteriales bacterium]
MDNTRLIAILNSIIEPIVFVDTNHVISFMNFAGIEKYKDRGGQDLLGKSIFDCHNENSNKIIKETFNILQSGLDEKFICITDKNEKYFIRAVRHESGKLLGYYERFEKNI